MMNPEPEEAKAKESRPESVTLKKGTLWQQRDKFFSRWKERFFILTSDYLACFKKASKIGISEMGGFLYKVNLADVDDLNWIDKKQDGVIAVKVGQEDQLLLWSSKGLDNWMFALRDAVNLSKGRREALRRSQTLMPQTSDGLIGRHRVNSHHSLSASPGPPGVRHSGSNLELCSNAGPFMRSLVDKHFMPAINEYSRRMSVLTEGDTSNDTDDAASSCEYYPVSRHTFGPRLAPQCSAGSHSSLVSLGRRSNDMHKPSPRSLQVSPALTQRSLYAQHILSSPEISQPPPPRTAKSSSAKSATSEFSFVHPDSPVAVSSLRLNNKRGSEKAKKTQQPVQQQSATIFRPSTVYGQSSINGYPVSNGQSSVYGQPTINEQSSVYSQPAVNGQSSSRPEQSSVYSQPAVNGSRHGQPAANGQSSSRHGQSSSYGQPVSNGQSSGGGKGQLPPDVVPYGAFTAGESQSMPKRNAKCYTHSKSDSNYADERLEHLQSVEVQSNSHKSVLM